MSSAEFFCESVYAGGHKPEKHQWSKEEYSRFFEHSNDLGSWDSGEEEISSFDENLYCDSSGFPCCMDYDEESDLYGEDV